MADSTDRDEGAPPGDLASSEEVDRDGDVYAPPRERVRRNASEPKLGWWALVFVFVGVVAWMIFVQLASASLLPPHEAVLAVQVVGILGAAIGYRYLRGEDAAGWPDLDRTGLGPGAWVLMLVAVVVVGLWANSLMALTVELIPSLEPMAEFYREQINKLVLKAEGMDRVLGLIGICLAAPVCEEALFRGTFLPEQSRSMSIFATVVGNGLLFGSFHLNPINLLPLSVVGAFLAHLVVLTGSLWPAIFAHAAMNGFNGVVLPELFPEMADGEFNAVAEGAAAAGRGELLVAFVVLGIVGVALWVWLAKILTSSPAQTGGS